MKKFLKCKITILLLAGWGILSAVGYLGKDTIYKAYAIDAKTTPYFVLVFQGIHDGIYPWSGSTEALWEKWEQLAEERRQQEELLIVENTEEVMTTESEMIAEATEIVEEEPKEFCEVEEDYFSDAVFIGDSRTVGLHDYGGLEDAEFYATVGMNIYDLWEAAFCEVDGKTVTLEEALSRQKFGKIYFQIGINEMGRGTVDGFMEAYAQTIAKFQELQPDAIIFVQGIMKVSKEKSENDAIFNNVGIEERNTRIAQLADGEHVFYLDMNEVVCDEDGNLKENLTFDDVHLYGSKYDIWVDYLLKHGILP